MGGPPVLDVDELRRRFPVSDILGTSSSIADVFNSLAGELAGYMVSVAPPGRELSLAITALEESVMWATKAVGPGANAR